ncbi:uncharacterized protein BX664DRAFT_344659 [Halteromyces radiatus]|uniref:uncharacterized protein n=1 Tax=Halteromyces radiatus TaxID=101107 RepID=UPI00221FEC7F|nr:uncharacterized protein BX664DRAFT_344659 [Halteromyces radiatus]KAI8098514.1 hypothetical protein BX664DRAFT_344659 [Halteromyces radiatus]
MLDKEMLGGIHLEEDIWANCIAIILGLIEDSLIDDETNYSKKTKHSRKKNDKGKMGSSALQPMLTPQPSLDSLKRKRSFTEDIRDRKLMRMSENLANDMARSLSVIDSSMDYMDSSASASTPVSISTSTPGPATSSIKPPIHLKPTTLGNSYQHTPSSSSLLSTYQDATTSRDNHQLDHVLFTSTTKVAPVPSTIAKFDQWIQQQAQLRGMTENDYRLYFDKQRYEFQYYMTQLQTMIHHQTVTFEQIKTCLQTILGLAEEMIGNQSDVLMNMFPEWRSWEGLVQKLTTYVKCVDDMNQLIKQEILPASDLREYIKDLHQLIETRTTLYGDFLIHNGLEWKAMGLPVKRELLDTTKHWFLNVCSCLLLDLENACSDLQEVTMDEEEWNPQSEHTEQVMDCLLQGLEVIGSILSFIGTTDRDINARCHILATVYGQWISESLEHLNQEQTGSRISIGKKSRNNHNSNTKTSSGRTDLRLMQRMESMIRLLSTLQLMQDFDDNRGKHTHQQPDSEKEEKEEEEEDEIGDAGTILETVTDTLVEVTVRAIAVIETHRSLGKEIKQGVTNIMTRPLQSGFIYMEESLLSFADKVVELSGREWIDGTKLQRLHLYLEELELSIAEDS